ncbi:MAG TPA: preprotein translocase subunit SecG [Candidatus Sulfotelmatobacter sp.]|nr:preprotein translocase subunit SecG [Candidatus Sulfotelmatobacter sp.]
MSFIIGILTFLLIVNCGILVLLILVQLPKKDAGAGLAFGGGTADALFGAGSGNALTKITKWATFGFVALAVLMGALQTRLSHGNSNAFEQGVESQQQMHTTGQPQVAPQPTAPHPGTSSSPAQTPGMQLYSATNSMPAGSTNGK